ncbi:MAG: RsmB/NOP family class I SAM-dependent RNA methyltransferase [Alphaproteobacteria bacterium]|nr:RsmB/NOP family class I SAM-dependent RNA methyltransferase [Alphaproteobacteria bacterium]
MKPQARIQAAIEILEKASESRVPMDTVTGDYMRGRRYIGAKDRAAVAERVYAVTRAHARLGWHLERAGVGDSPRGRVIVHLMLAEEASAKRLGDLFDGSSYAPPVLDDQEQGLIRALDELALEHPDMPDAVRVECPPLYEPTLRGYFGESFAAELGAMIPGAPLDLRVNTFLIPRENARDSLAKDEVETDPTPFSPWGLRARAKVYLAKTKAFSKGWVDIQDEGSQMIAHICGVRPGMQVLDFCAGGGGKTLALAAAMERKGRIVAMDTDERRLEKGRERYRKAQVADIIEVRPLTDKHHTKWLRRQKGTFDVVLCDVPCSGTGTWRRNPDMRWAVYGPRLEELMIVQAEILDRVAEAVKPGGKLVYATCSLLPEENERQVEAFLVRHPEFTVMAPENPALGAPFMRLTPLRHNTDGFFAATLIRAEETAAL